VPGRSRVGYKGVEPTGDGLRRLPHPRRRRYWAGPPDAAAASTNDGRRRGPAGSTSPPAAAGSAQRAFELGIASPNSARPSARRSPNTRPCSSASLTWRAKVDPPTDDCDGGAQEGLRRTQDLRGGRWPKYLGPRSTATRSWRTPSAFTAARDFSKEYEIERPLPRGPPCCSSRGHRRHPAHDHRAGGCWRTISCAG